MYLQTDIAVCRRLTSLYYYYAYHPSKKNALYLHKLDTRILSFCPESPILSNTQLYTHYIYIYMYIKICDIYTYYILYIYIYRR
jgi:hypothetical protein